MQNKKNLRELPTTNIPKKLKKQKPEIFYEMQNHKKSEGTTWNKQTKKQNFKKKIYERQNNCCTAPTVEDYNCCTAADGR